MHIDRALKLVPGDRVRVPDDHTAKVHAHMGKVAHVGQDQNSSIAGERYIWIIVEHPVTGNKSVWPSNRLG